MKQTFHVALTRICIMEMQNLLISRINYMGNFFILIIWVIYLFNFIISYHETNISVLYFPASGAREIIRMPLSMFLVLIGREFLLAYSRGKMILSGLVETSRLSLEQRFMCSLMADGQ